MSRYLVILLALNIQGFATIANASNDLDKWNSEQGRVVRSALKEKLSTTTYRELPNIHSDSTYKASENGGKVLTKIETKAELKGSRVGATIDALKTVNKSDVAKKWAKELGKGGLKFTVGAILIEEAMQQMLDGIGWIMDEGGKVTKKPDLNSPDPKNQQCSLSNDNCSWAPSFFFYGDYPNILFGTSDGAVNFRCQTRYGAISCSGFYYSGDGYYGNAHMPNGEIYSNIRIGDISSKSNPHYLAGSSEPSVDYSVSQAEMEQKINNYFNDPKSPPSKDLLIEQALKPEGKASIMWSDDPSSEQTIFSDHKNTAEKILNSDNPQGEGLTKTTPVITDGTTTETETNTDTTTNTDVNETTTTNPDGSTTTTGTNTSSGSSSTTSTSKLPAFCDYASKLCDWLDWTKEMPEDEEKPEEENINDRGIFNRELDTQFNLEGSCPSDFNFQMTNKYFAGSYTIPLNWLCISFTFIGYALIFLSNCIGMWILYETVTRKELRF